MMHPQRPWTEEHNPTFAQAKAKMTKHKENCTLVDGINGNDEVHITTKHVHHHGLPCMSPNVSFNKNVQVTLGNRMLGKGRLFIQACLLFPAPCLVFGKIYLLKCKLNLRQR